MTKWSWVQTLAQYTDGCKRFEFFSETNPQIESLRIGLANPDLPVLKSRWVRIWDSPIRIFKDLFCAIIPRIREDLLDSWNRWNLLKIDWIRDHNTNWIFWSLDLWSLNQYKSMDSQNKSTFLLTSYTIPTTLLKAQLANSIRNKFTATQKTYLVN